MKATHKNYDFQKSLERLDSILKSNNNNYEEKEKRIPSRDKLTYTNGFYVNVSAIFVDIRDSSNLSNIHRRPTLAKIYRSFISEVVAIMNSYSNCHEISIIGDCISGIFETPFKKDIDDLFNLSARINTIVNIINCKLTKEDIVNIKVGIGIDKGRALMIKAGHYGSEINEIVWMGDVVNNASKLCNNANRENSQPILISDTIYEDLDKKYEPDIPFKFNRILSAYECNVIDEEMGNWWEENCI